MSKRVLVTGGFGRVGRQVIPLLLSDGYRIRVFDIVDNESVDFHKEVEICLGDITNYSDVKTSMEGVDMVCHLAALFPPFFFEEFKIFDVNVKGTFNVLQAIKEQGSIEKLVFASTDATYATGTSFDEYNKPLTEDMELWPINVYGIAKAINELMIEKYSRLFNIPYIILRFFWSMVPKEMVKLMFEARNYEDLICNEDKVGLKQDDIVAPILENGDVYYDHITDSRDIASGVHLALKNSNVVNEIFNIAGPDKLNYCVQAEKVAKALKRSFRKVRCKDIKNYEASIEKARSLLGYAPKYTMDKMIDEAIRENAVKGE